MLDRPPLDADRVRSVAGEGWSRIEIVEQTTSTNTDLLADVSIADRSVLVAEEQTAGRGRLDRAWSSTARAGLTFSVALRPTVPVSRWGWLPLLCGLAVVDAVREVSRVTTTLKWPNDVLADGEKLAGILVQAADGVAVLGVGLNVSQTRAELPVPTATSLQLADATRSLDRSELLGGVLVHLGEWLDRWHAAGGDAAASGLAGAYRTVCSTLGAEVRVSLGAGRVLEGRATGVDDSGRIVVTAADGVHVLSAGDVEHLRPSH